MTVLHFYLGLALGVLTLVSVPYLRSRLGVERTRKLALDYLLVSSGLFAIHRILFEGVYGFELLPVVPDDIGGMILFPGLALFVLAGITFLAAVWTASVPNPEH